MKFNTLMHYLLIVFRFLKSTSSQIAETALLGEEKYHTQLSYNNSHLLFI